MIELLIRGVKRALRAKAYMVALSLALTILDICGKAEYLEKIGLSCSYPVIT